MTELKFKRFLTRAETCQYMRICKATLDKYSKIEGFPIVRFSRSKVLIDREKLDTWIEEHTGV